MSDGAIPMERADDTPSEVISLKVQHAEKEISEHGRRIGRVEQQINDLALAVTRLVETNEASRRFTSGVLKVLGIAAAVMSVGITILFNLLGRHP